MMQTVASSLRRATLLALFLAGSRWGAAQTGVPEVYPLATPALDDTTQVQLQLQPDTLVAEPAVFPAAPTPAELARLAWLQTPPELRDLVADRINCFETDVPHVFNGSVMGFVNLFTLRNRSYMQRVLERENLYFPLFEKYLAQYNLPQDLKYLAVVESALIPTAKSHVGALGLWQFMGPTAGDLRLKRDEWIDERMSPEKSTQAACKHLRYLYGVFHDWELVLAAYNWGAGSVQRVMKRTGKRNFWELYPYMPAETRNYVPTFTAIMYTMKYAEAHKLRTPELKYQYAEAMDTLQLSGQAFDMCRLSQACGYADSMALLRFNPEFRRPSLPAGYRSVAVQFPATVRPRLNEVDRAILFDYCQPKSSLPQPMAPRLPHLDGVEPFPTATLAAAKAAREETTAAPVQPTRRIRHTVRRGETVASVAEKFAVSPAQLRRWNGLRKGRALTPHQQLVMFVPVDNEPEAQEKSTAVAKATVRKPVVTAKPPLPAEKTVPAEAAARAETPATADVVKASYPVEKPIAKTANTDTPATKVATTAADDTVPTGAYVVRKGDYLTRLARERGVTVAQLVAWNHLTSETVVPGQKLVFQGPALTGTEAQTSLATASAVAGPTNVRHSANSLHNGRKVHLVQPGDTLYNISRRYEGVTVEQLRKLNNLKTDAVKPGQKLIVQG